jgi:SAM-dependent methyltransferase
MRTGTKMMLAEILRNKIRGFVFAFGNSTVKQFLWNSEFSHGRWNCLDSSAADCVYSHIERFAKGGSILDLGCGAGNTLNELDSELFEGYTGVDISDVAIGRAKERAERNGRAHKGKFFQADISTYVPDQLYDVILFRDTAVRLNLVVSPAS